MPLLDSIRNYAGQLGNAIVGRAPSAKVQNPSSDQVEAAGRIPEHIKARLSGWGEPANLSRVLTDISKIQAAVYQAERGDTKQLFTLYRDFTLSVSHIQAELQKRKMVVLGQPYSLQPIDKDNPNDVAACDAITEMIENCENWDEGMGHLLDACIWPVSCCEKIYEPYVPQPDDKIPLRFFMRRLSPINPVLLSYKLPYMAQGGMALPAFQGGMPPVSIPIGGNPDTVWNPDQWEPDLRFYHTFPNGNVDYSYANMYAPDPIRHVVHRGSCLNGIRDNYGGVFKAVMFWGFLGIQARDWWAQFMQRYGAPFLVGKTNVEDKSKVDFMQKAFQMATVIRGIVIDKNAELVLEKCDTAGSAEGFKMFLDLCDDQISKVIVGQTLSTSPKATGMGSGVADLQGQVRDDIRSFDQKMICNTLKRQVFRPFLEINGLQGAAPNIVFGGLDDADVKSFADSLVSLKNAGLRVSEESMETVSERVGLNMEIAPEPEPAMAGGNKNGGKRKPGD